MASKLQRHERRRILSFDVIAPIPVRAPALSDDRPSLHFHVREAIRTHQDLQLGSLTPSGIITAARSALGQTRRFGPSIITSGLPPTSDIS
jgi:hypothetical protein